MGMYRSRTHRGQENAADRARRFRWRIGLLTVAFIVAFVVLFGRAVMLMAFENERLETLARRQHRQVVNLNPKRGVIFDRNGSELARSVEMVSIFADPKLVEDAAVAAEGLAPLLKMSAEHLEAKLTQQLRFVWLARRIPSKEAKTILSKGIAGIYSVKETRRYYPNRGLAAAVLGFTGIDNTGLEGIERAYNEILNGQVSSFVRLRDARGRNITPEGVLFRQNLDGCHMVLTLDQTLQFEAEKALTEVYTEFKPKGAFMIVMDPRTGEILAMANAPGYNPNAFGDARPEQFRNRAVADSFEPGSTQKCFLVAAALNEGVVTADDVFDCEKGRYRIGRQTVGDTHKYELLTVSEIVKLSSNIGAVKIGEALGKQRLYEYYRAFGFGSRLESGLPGEVRGVIRRPESWTRIGLATHAFGQGMSVNGLQIASALSAIANGGVRMKPYIVKEVRDQQGKVLERNEPRVVNRVVSEETARAVTQMMSLVTLKGGTGTKAAIPGYSVAGKTGTGQKVDPETRRYGHRMYTSSFVGFVPAEDPRLVIVTVLDEPQGRWYYGGTVAAPAFARVAEAGMRYLGVPPEPVAVDGEGAKPARTPLVARITLPEVATDSDERPDPLPIPMLESVPLEEGEEAQGGYVVPDFSGQTMRRVLAAVDNRDVVLRLRGTGVAVSQTPKVGKRIQPGDVLTVLFEPVDAPIAEAIRLGAR